MNVKPPQLIGAASPLLRCKAAAAQRWCSPAMCRAKSSTPEVHVRMYWDLDNIKAPARSKDCNKILQALKDTVAAAASEGLSRPVLARSVELHGHCNRHSFHSLSKELKEALLTQSGLCLSTALHERAEAVDQDIIASMLRFAVVHRCNACMGVISGDQGFAVPLRYCRSLGCYTVAVCKYATFHKGRSYSGKGRSNKWARQPMQEAVHSALSWDAILDASGACNTPTAA